MAAHLGRVVLNYRLVDELGKGGFGTVYLGVHEDLGRRAAVKVLRPEHTQEDQLVDRFFREARFVCSIGHPDIVVVENSGRLGTGEPFYIMEYVDGRALNDLVRDRGPLDADDLVAVFGPLAGALGAAHARGIVHRDLKPHNVMVREKDGAVAGIKLLDFGIAKLLHTADPGSQTGSMMGTPHYMSPEQAVDAKNVDVTADVYSFAATLFTAATGEKPFRGATVTEVLVRVQNDPPPRIADLRPGLPAAVDDLVARCMAKEPAERPPSIRDAWALLRAALRGEELPAIALAEIGGDTTARASAGEVTASTATDQRGRAARSRRKGRRRRVLGAVVAVAVAGGLATAIVLGTAAPESDRERRAGAGDPPVPADAGALVAASAIDAGAPPDATVVAAVTVDAAPPSRRRPRRRRRRPAAAERPHAVAATPDAGPARSRTVCTKTSFAVVYNAEAPARSEVLAALKRLRVCRGEGVVTASEFDKIQAALVAKL